MDPLLAMLRACAEPTRLRLLALAARGSFCVVEFTEILGQSQPRLSRHLRLLCEAGLLQREREGANVWFSLPDDAPGLLARDLLRRLPAEDPLLAADARQAARVLAERARVASDSFSRQGADWDEMRALGLDAPAVGRAVLRLLRPRDRLLDIGTGTGALLELAAPHVAAALGIDASRQMLALARARLARPGLSHCAVRQADMYRLPLADGTFDVAVLQMVLHYAEHPAAAVAEAARVLRPDGRLLVVDLAAHDDAALAARLAHRWPGFSDAAMQSLFDAAGLHPAAPQTVGGPLAVRLWSAHLPVPLTAPLPRHAAHVA
jgi:ArsR family transcriptional regulator